MYVVLTVHPVGYVTSEENKTTVALLALWCLELNANMFMFEKGPTAVLSPEAPSSVSNGV